MSFLSQNKSNAEYSVIVRMLWVLEDECYSSKIGWGLDGQYVPVHIRIVSLKERWNISFRGRLKHVKVCGKREKVFLFEYYRWC